MTDDLTRARQHLSEAERLLDGDVERAIAHASIAKGLVALHAGEHLDRMAKPLRFTLPDGVPQTGSPGGYVGPTRAERERAALDAADRRAARDRAVAEVGRLREETRAQLREDESGWSPMEQVFDDPTPGPARGAGGIFGQMEERPNALEDQGEH